MTKPEMSKWPNIPVCWKKREPIKKNTKKNSFYVSNLRRKKSGQEIVKERISNGDQKKKTGDSWKENKQNKQKNNAHNIFKKRSLLL